MNIKLKDSILFTNWNDNDISDILTCLMAVEKYYKKDTYIYHAGEIIQAMGLVLSGCVQIEYNDIWGNQHILQSIEPGNVFAETYATLINEPLMIHVKAIQDTTIVFLRCDKLLTTCEKHCHNHQQLIQRMLQITSQKNLQLSRKILHTSSKSIRGKLLSYLSYEAVKQQRHDITIPFNRQQLANYLNVERSAMSYELSKMRKEGILKTHKQYFWLNDAFSNNHS